MLKDNRIVFLPMPDMSQGKVWDLWEDEAYLYNYPTIGFRSTKSESKVVNLQQDVILPTISIGRNGDQNNNVLQSVKISFINNANIDYELNGFATKVTISLFTTKSATDAVGLKSKTNIGFGNNKDLQLQVIPQQRIKITFNNSSNLTAYAAINTKVKLNIAVQHSVLYTASILTTSKLTFSNTANLGITSDIRQKVTCTVVLSKNELKTIALKQKLNLPIFNIGYALDQSYALRTKVKLNTLTLSKNTSIISDIRPKTQLSLMHGSSLTAQTVLLSKAKINFSNVSTIAKTLNVYSNVRLPLVSNHQKTTVVNLRMPVTFNLYNTFNLGIEVGELNVANGAKLSFQGNRDLSYQSGLSSRTSVNLLSNHSYSFTSNIRLKSFINFTHQHDKYISVGLKGKYKLSIVNTKTENSSTQLRYKANLSMSTTHAISFNTLLKSKYMVAMTVDKNEAKSLSFITHSKLNMLNGHTLNLNVNVKQKSVVSFIASTNESFTTALKTYNRVTFSNQMTITFTNSLLTHNRMDMTANYNTSLVAPVRQSVRITVNEPKTTGSSIGIQSKVRISFIAERNYYFRTQVALPADLIIAEPIHDVEFDHPEVQYVDLFHPEQIYF